VKVDAIKSLLQDKLRWNRARLDCFALFVSAVIMQRTVNLVLLSVCSHTGSPGAWAYRRFQRFLSGFKMPMGNVARLVLGLLPVPQDGYGAVTE
jgi:hypothetical protein